jgi:hypothetical protein
VNPLALAPEGSGQGEGPGLERAPFMVPSSA